MEIKLKLSNEEHKELVAYCNLNDLLISSVVKDSFTTGFNIERYGLLNAGIEQSKEIIKEVIVEKKVEIPVETIKEVVKVEYVEVEKPIEKIVEKEIIKEVPIEKFVEKEIIKEVIKEVPIEKVVVKEVIKEIPIEKVVEKIIKVSDDTQINELLSKIQQLENQPAKIVEVVKEVPVDKVVVQEKIVEVVKEIPVEVVKEVIIEKTSSGDLQSKIDALQNTVQKLKHDNIEKDKKIKEFEKTIQDIQKFQEDKKAMFLRGSNLDDNLYK